MINPDNNHRGHWLTASALILSLSTTTCVLAQPQNNAGGPPPEGMQPPGMQQAIQIDRSQDCDRACLREHADDYLKALAANDPGCIRCK